MNVTTGAMPDDTATDDKLYREAANDRWVSDELEIDDDATVSVGVGGAFVHAWVWVSNAQAGIEKPPDVGDQ